MSQLDGMLSLLRRIDDSFVPENDFDTALANAVPVVRNQLTNPINATHAVDAARGPATVKGQAAQAQHIEVSLIENSSTQAAADAAAEATRKAELAAQNALPVWHTQSTVAGENPNTASNVPHRPSRSLKSDPKAEDEDTKPLLTTEPAENDELAAYYAAMAAEAREAERLEAEEAEEEEEDSTPTNGNDGDAEEEDFEDVIDANTPLPSGTNGTESRHGIPTSTTSINHSSGTSSGTETPLIESSQTKTLSMKRASQEQGDEGGADSKKIKLEPGDEDSDEDEDEDEDDDDEDGVEFEDV
jgi:transcription initiation factor TFIIE subunit alpha